MFIEIKRQSQQVKAGELARRGDAAVPQTDTSDQVPSLQMRFSRPWPFPAPDRRRTPTFFHG